MRRSDPRQLDLFRTTQTVVAFPLHRRADLCRRLASDLLAIPTKTGRDRRWVTEVNKLAKDFRRLGLSDAAISAHVLALRTAVGCEARRRVHLAILRGEVAS